MPASKKSLSRRSLVHGVGVNDVDYDVNKRKFRLQNYVNRTAKYDDESY